MSALRRGIVPQLRKLTLMYSPDAGSSRGMRYEICHPTVFGTPALLSYDRAGHSLSCVCEAVSVVQQCFICCSFYIKVRAQLLAGTAVRITRPVCSGRPLFFLLFFHTRILCVWSWCCYALCIYSLVLLRPSTSWQSVRTCQPRPRTCHVSRNCMICPFLLTSFFLFPFLPTNHNS